MILHRPNKQYHKSCHILGKQQCKNNDVHYLNSIINSDKIKINDVEISSKINMLHHACYNSSYEIIKWLVDHEININAQDCFGYTPIMILVNSSQFIRDKDLLYKCARFLINNGADPMIPEKWLNTALSKAKCLYDLDLFNVMTLALEDYKQNKSIKSNPDPKLVTSYVPTLVPFNINCNIQVNLDKPSPTNNNISAKDLYSYIMLQAILVKYYGITYVKSYLHNVECPICMETLENCNTLVTKCGHPFHPDCLLRSVREISFRKCPSCNKIYPYVDPDITPNLVSTNQIYNTQSSIN